MRPCSADRARRLCLSALAALLAASPHLAAQALDLEPALAASQAVVGRSIGNYTLTASDGGRVRLADYRGKPLVVDFVYTGCTQVCPTTTRFLAQALREAQGALGESAFNAVTVGFNLPFDDPRAMADFRRRTGADLPRWAFLSPQASDVAALTADFGFVYSPAVGGFDHLSQVTIVDGEGRVYRQIYGESFALPMLVGPLKELVTGQRSPTSTLPTLLERVRILCTVYDPLTGRYRLDYGLFIELIAGVSILGAIAYYLAHEWRRQRRTA